MTLYRDTAAWCPYCEKVWLLLEEKRVPYAIEKVNMNCYGEKPEWFWQMQPSGGIPVAKVDGQVVRESNDIMMAIEGVYADQRPMLPAADDPRSARVRPLLQLERELFSCWFRWLTSGFNNGAQRINFEATLDAYLDPDAWACVPAAPPPALRVRGKNVKLVARRRGVLRAAPREKHAAALDAMPSLMRFEPAYEVGDEVIETRDLNTCAGFAHLLHADQAAIDRDYHALHALDLFEVAESDELA